MRPSTHCDRASWPRTLCLLTLLTAGAAAQNTIPFWGTYFGDAGRDEAVAVCQGPGTLVTIVGHTDSPVMPQGLWPGLQPTYGGGQTDAFVARFDISLPPAQQLLWSTYIGGDGLDLAFDAEVDPVSGATTLVGLTMSSSGFPGQPPNPLNGPSDGFVIQLGPAGTTLQSSVLVGGSAHDRLCEVEFDTGGLLLVAGVTESTNLPVTAGTVFPTYRGGLSDTFVARVDPVQATVLLATYIGCAGNNGADFAGWPGWGNSWTGNLDRMGLCLDPATGGPVVATIANTQCPVTPNACQLVNASGNVYLVQLDAAFATMPYATFHGGSVSDRPKAVAAHPGGGFVVVGVTFSPNMPVTQGCLQSTFQACTPSCRGVDCDGFVCHIDPAIAGAAGRRYSTFLGGPLGEDALLDVAVESSGVVTAVGYTHGALPTGPTPRCLQDTLVQRSNGLIARLSLDGRGSRDLHYATFVGGASVSARTLLRGVDLDDDGDTFVAAETDSPVFQVLNAFQPVNRGGIDAAVLHLPLLPGCTGRGALACRTPACTAPLYTGMAGAPIPGTTFEFTATNAPPGAFGALLLGGPMPCAPLQNGNLLIAPPPSVTVVLADGLGAASVAVFVPAALPAACPWGLGAQWLFLTNPACPGTGLLANSERLDF